MDFYLFGFEEFNECNCKFLKGGITPLVTPDPKDPNINTLVRFISNLWVKNKIKNIIFFQVRFSIALKEAPIPKTKTYLEYLIKPSLKKEDELKFRGCERSYNEV